MIIEAVFFLHLPSPSARRCQTPQRTHLINLDNIPDESCTNKKRDQIRWPNHSSDTSDGVEERTIKYLKTSFMCCMSLVEAWRWVGGIVPDGETKEKKAGWSMFKRSSRMTLKFYGSQSLLHSWVLRSPHRTIQMTIDHCMESPHQILTIGFN